MRYAIVGFGCAGFNGARAIRTEDPPGEIHVFEQTGAPPANPMLTTYYASEAINYKAIFPFGTLEEIRAKYGLIIHSEVRVAHVRAESRELVFENGTVDSFDRILIATGARAFVPPIEGYPSDRTFLMRTTADAVRLKTYLDATPVKKAVVVGASMVGIKVAELLLNRGVETTIADFAEFLFPVAAFRDVAEELEERVRSRGISFAWHKGVAGIGEKSVRFSDGTELEADIVCLCIGTRANTELLANKEVVEGESVRINRGIVVDDHMRTTVPGIYAAGDCCEGRNLLTGETMIIGLWQNAGFQGDTAGHNMAGADRSYRGTIPHNITHFMDIYFIGIGDNRAIGEMLTFGSLKGPLFVKAVQRKGALRCVNIIGNSEVGGILKSFFLKQLSTSAPAHLPTVQRMVLMKNGLPADFIDLLEGGLR